MTFEPDRLGAQLDSIGGGLVRIFGYNAIETLTDLFVADYITNCEKYGLRVGDILLVRGSDGTAFLLQVVSISDAGHGTLSLLDQIEVNATWFGASPSAPAATNTRAIQTAIDLMHGLPQGGTVVVSALPEGSTYNLGASTLTDIVLNSGVPRAISDFTHLVLRNKVRLAVHAGVTLQCTLDTHAGIIPLDITDWAELVGPGRLRGVAGSENGTHTTSGVINRTSTEDQTSVWRNFWTRDLEISNFPAYGFELFQARFINCGVKGLYVHDIGGDGIDIKPAPNTYGVDGVQSTAYVVADCKVVKFGQRDNGGSNAGFDLRGLMQVSNVQALDFVPPTGVVKTCTGFRISSGLELDANGLSREPNQYSTYTNLIVDSGDPSIDNIYGIHLFGCRNNVINWSVRNCRTGLNLTTSTSGFPEGSRNLFTGGYIEGSRLVGVENDHDNNTFIGVRVEGQRDRFSNGNAQDAGNLVAGQVVFVTPRAHDVATLKVYKNDVLVDPGDYTINSTTQITLDTGVSDGDRLDIVTPTPVGFQVDADYSTLVACHAENTTDPLAFSANNALTCTITASPTLEMEQRLYPSTTFSDSAAGTGTVGTPIYERINDLNSGVGSVDQVNPFAGYVIASRDASGVGAGDRVGVLATYGSSNGGATNIHLAYTPTTAGTFVLGMTLEGSTGNIGINNTNPNDAAVLDIVSTTKGVLLPRMTQTERDAISAPTDGLLIYNTTSHVVNFYNGSTWGAI